MGRNISHTHNHEWTQQSNSAPSSSLAASTLLKLHFLPPLEKHLLISSHYKSHIIVMITNWGMNEEIWELKTLKEFVSLTRRNHKKNQLKVDEEQKHSAEKLSSQTSHQEPQDEGNVSLWFLEGTVYWFGSTACHLCHFDSPPTPIITSCFPWRSAGLVL